MEIRVPAFSRVPWEETPRTKYCYVSLTSSRSSRADIYFGERAASQKDRTVYLPWLSCTATSHYGNVSVHLSSAGIVAYRSNKSRGNRTAENQFQTAVVFFFRLWACILFSFFFLPSSEPIDLEHHWNRPFKISYTQILNRYKNIKLHARILYENQYMYFCKNSYDNNCSNEN